MRTERTIKTGFFLLFVETHFEIFYREYRNVILSMTDIWSFSNNDFREVEFLTTSIKGINRESDSRKCQDRQIFLLVLEFLLMNLGLTINQYENLTSIKT